MPLSQSPKKETIFLGKNSKYTQEQNIELSKKPNTKSPEQLVTENLAFVYHLVDKEFSIYYKTRGISREDLVSAGMMGLVTAASRSKYGTFLRYASFWIRYFIYKEIRNFGLIRRPASFCGVLNKIRKHQESYKYSHGGVEPPMEWLMKVTGFSEKVISETLEIDETNSTTVLSIEDMRREDDGVSGRSLYDSFASDDGRSVQKDEARIDVGMAMEALTDEEAEVVRMHFYDGMNVNEIARDAGVTVKEVNSTLKEALRKLRDVIEETEDGRL